MREPTWRDEPTAHIDAGVTVSADSAGPTPRTPNAYVTFIEDEIYIEWGGGKVVASISQECGFAYAIKDGDHYVPGKHEENLEDAIKEIRETLKRPPG